ncbi:MAG: TIGR01777 family protein [Bacteroidia bacterium]|nr:TIGR01777 family protein [Bacteroidia bacterium]
MKRILITGGSGLIGQGLTPLLQSKGYEVLHLGRKENLSGKVKTYKWNVEEGKLDERAFENIDSIVHLAGMGIADARWSEKRKKEIIDSRVKSSELLFNVIEKNKIKLSSFIGASAVGFYGAVSSEKIYTEADPAASDFLGTCCRLWEESYNGIISTGVRTVIIRVGVVLSGRGGALVKMAGPVKKGIGSALGNGKQIVPWIHEKDICGIFLKAIEDESMKGIFNASAPQFQSNAELTGAIAKQLNKKLWAPAVPAFVLKIMFGEMAGMFLQGSKVSTEKIQKEGYSFQFPEISDAMKNLL